MITDIDTCSFFESETVIVPKPPLKNKKRKKDTSISINQDEVDEELPIMRFKQAESLPEDTNSLTAQ